MQVNTDAQLAYDVERHYRRRPIDPTEDRTYSAVALTDIEIPVLMRHVKPETLFAFIEQSFGPNYGDFANWRITDDSCETGRRLVTVEIDVTADAGEGDDIEDKLEWTVEKRSYKNGIGAINVVELRNIKRV